MTDGNTWDWIEGLDDMKPRTLIEKGLAHLADAYRRAGENPPVKPTPVGKHEFARMMALNEELNKTLTVIDGRIAQ